MRNSGSWFLLFFLFQVHWSAADDLPALSPNPSPSPAAEKKLSPAESRNQLREFTAAQSAALRRLKRQKRTELQTLRRSHKLEYKEWKLKEQSERKKFFEAHIQGPERRAYIEEFMRRRESFLQSQSQKLSQLEQSQGTEQKKAVEDQAEKRRKFQEAIRKGEKPPQELWP